MARSKELDGRREGVGRAGDFTKAEDASMLEEVAGVGRQKGVRASTYQPLADERGGIFLCHETRPQDSRLGDCRSHRSKAVPSNANGVVLVASVGKGA